MSTWVSVPPDSDFTLANLPYGVASGRVHVAIGDHAVDLVGLVALGVLDAPVDWFNRGVLNPFLHAGADAWASVREQLVAILEGDDRPDLLVPRAALDLRLPIQ